MELVKRPFGNINCEDAAAEKKLSIGFRHWNTTERKKCYMDIKVFALLLRKKFWGDLMFRITYTWTLTGRSLRIAIRDSNRHTMFGCTNSRTYELKPVFIHSYRKNIEAYNTKASTDVYAQLFK